MEGAAEGDFEVSMVVGRSDEGGEEPLEQGGIVVDDLPVESEGADGVRIGDVCFDVGVDVWSAFVAVRGNGGDIG